VAGRSEPRAHSALLGATVIGLAETSPGGSQEGSPRIARRGVETGDRLGRRRWPIERSIGWLTGYRRLPLRYERCARLFTAFLTLAATLTCHKKLAT
jgi:hypothetical protein